jgi:Uma2 family endonuclease
MAEPAPKERPMTFEEAARLDPDEHPGELDRGKWVPVTRNTWLHGKIMINVGALLKQYAREHPGWSVASGDPGTKLARDPDLLRGPDVAVLRADREPTGRGAGGWVDGAPELVVEISGDDQSASELAAKALEYLAAGGKAVWVVDPHPRRVIVYTPPALVRVLGPDDILDGGEALPGFACKVADLFE